MELLYARLMCESLWDHPLLQNRSDGDGSRQKLLEVKRGERKNKAGEVGGLECQLGTDRASL